MLYIIPRMETKVNGFFRNFFGKFKDFIIQYAQKTYYKTVTNVI